jgi:outer membrane receptor protein involved in Fe transport
MYSSRSRILVLISALLLICVRPSHGQTAVTGGIEGNVTDTSGAPVSGARVQVTNTADGVIQTTVTNNDGAYNFPSLIPGTYSITAGKTGFAQYTREGTRIDAGLGVRIDVRLTVGAAVSEVKVTGEAPLLQTDSSEISETIQANDISTIPTFGNNITRLSVLAPGAFYASGQLDLHPENAGEDFNVNVNGAQPNANGHLLDGVENTEAIQGLSLIVAAQDSVQEVKLTTSDYDAQYGKVSGGLWQVTTKSGTNSMHGSAYEYYRTAGFFANDNIGNPGAGVPGNIWNQFGGSLGGHIVKDKLFYFGDYQGMRNNFHTFGVNTVPIDAFKAGDFSSIAATEPIYDPATGNADGTGRTQISCNGVLNVICPDRISPAATKLLALLPEPNISGLDTQNYTVSRPALFDQNQFDTRGDYFISPKTMMFGKYSYFNASFFTDTAYGVAGGGPPLSGAVNAGNSADHDKQFMLNYQHTFSPSLLTDARIAVSRIVISELQLDSSTDAATAVGIPDINLGTVYTSGLPELSIQDPATGFVMGDEGLPFFEREINYEVYDDWTKTLGHHTFKFGEDIGKFFGARTDVSGRGTFQINQGLTELNTGTCTTGCQNAGGSGLAAFELGLSSDFSRDITLIQPQEKLWKYAFYGQDTWQVTPRLTLSLGVRWDYLSPIFTANGESEAALDLNTNDLHLTNLAGKYAGVTTPKTEFSPRLGASYRLFKDTVLRGGYGRSYFLNADGGWFGTQGSAWPIKQTQSDSSANPYAAVGFTLDQGPGIPPPVPTFPTNGIVPFNGGPTGYSIYFVPTGNYPHSYNDSYNVTLEQAFPKSIIASIAYAGNVGRNLWDNIDVNAPVPGPDVAGSYNPNRPYYASFGWTQEEYERSNAPVGYPVLKSNYNSLQGHIEKRFHSGLYLLSNVTWDKSLDEGTFGPEGNQFDFASDYGNSDATRPWAWVSAATWELPVGRGKAIGNYMNRGADAVVGGWTLSGVFNLQAGQYFTVYWANSAPLNSTEQLRPNRDGSATVPNPNRNEWYNPADFSQPAAYTYGNSGRNILPGPGYREVDLSLIKTFSITERTHLQLKWDAFNAFNDENLANPQSDADAANAGQILGIVDYRRRMQIGAHFTF